MMNWEAIFAFFVAMTPFLLLALVTQIHSLCDQWRKTSDALEHLLFNQFARERDNVEMLEERKKDKVQLNQLKADLSLAQQRLDYCLGVLRRHDLTLNLRHPKAIQKLIEEKEGE